MDLNRVKFLLRAYLRVRLAKVRRRGLLPPQRTVQTMAAHALMPAARQIEEHVLHTIKEEQLFARLSPQEQEFAKGCARESGHVRRSLPG
jgi:hypothetical protein